MLTAPATRPETYSALLRRSLSLYRQTLRNAFVFSLLLAITLFIPRLLSVAVGQEVPLPTVTVSQVALFIMMYISAWWFLAAILWCINRIERNKHENFIVDFEMAGKRILYVLGAALLLFFIGALVGAISLGLHLLFWQLKLYAQAGLLRDSLFLLVLILQAGFSIFIATLFYFYFPLIVVENDGIFLALRQSAKLVWGHFRRVWWLQATPWVIYLTVLLLIKSLLNINIHIYFLPMDPATFYPTVLHIVILALFIPWSSALVLVQLRDLELRQQLTAK